MGLCCGCQPHHRWALICPNICIQHFSFGNTSAQPSPNWSPVQSSSSHKLLLQTSSRSCSSSALRSAEKSASSKRPLKPACSSTPISHLERSTCWIDHQKCLIASVHNLKPPPWKDYNNLGFAQYKSKCFLLILLLSFSATNNNEASDVNDKMENIWIYEWNTQISSDVWPENDNRNPSIHPFIVPADPYLVRRNHWNHKKKILIRSCV